MSEAISKVTPPLPSIVTFYQIYSTVTLALIWLMLPILLYVIFTQSHNLKEFKWTVLNHSFWCLALETVLGITKPVLLTPAFAGFQLGPFRYTFGNNATGITGGMCCAMISSCIFALCATLASRYLLIFPSKLKDWFTVKKFFYIGVLLPLLFYLLFGITVYLSGSDELEQNFKWAIEYDPILEYFINTEPTFTFVPNLYHNRIDIILIIFFAALFLGSFTIIIFFKYQVSKHKTVSLNRLHRSLILSSIFQILFTCTFLFLPIISLVIIIYLNIPNSANYMCFMLCLLTSHGFVEFIATLYFIHPYRMFIIRLFYSKVLKKPIAKTVIIPSFAASSVAFDRRTANF